MIPDWNSITTDSQVWRHNLIHKRNNLQFSQLSNFCRNISVSTKLGYMDKDISNKTGHSGNMADLPASKKERVIARILATKFHTEPTTDSTLEVRLNPIMRDLVINRRAIKKKRRKRKKKETIAEMTESVKENQLV
jgi:hypothetical protein